MVLFSIYTYIHSSHFFINPRDNSSLYHPIHILASRLFTYDVGWFLECDIIEDDTVDHIDFDVDDVDCALNAQDSGESWDPVVHGT